MTAEPPREPGRHDPAPRPGPPETVPSPEPGEAAFRGLPAPVEVDELRRSFDRVAEVYATEFFHELDHKPFDRDRLRRFARDCTNPGIVLDVGCGPGHVGRFLAGEHLRVVGLDVSEASARVARGLNPDLAFVVADMQTLPLRDGASAGLVAFYSLIYWEPATVAAILREFRRVLRPGRPLLLAVHAGEGSERFTEFHGQPIEITLRFHQPERLAASVESARFTVDAVETRAPYDFEHPTTRLYIRARAT